MLEVVNGEPELSQNFFKRNPRVVLQPLACFRYCLFLFRSDRLVINGGIGDGTRDGVEHRLQQADDGLHLGLGQAIDEVVGVFFGFGFCHDFLHRLTKNTPTTSSIACPRPRWRPSSACWRRCSTPSLVPSPMPPLMTSRSLRKRKRQ